MRTKFRHYEDRGRCNLRTGGGQGGDRAAGSALGSPAANRHRARGERLRVADTFYARDGELRLFQRPLDLKAHKLVFCYELATDFADLYRDYCGPEVSARRRRRATTQSAGRDVSRRGVRQSERASNGKSASGEAGASGDAATIRRPATSAGLGGEPPQAKRRPLCQTA
jgi:hypothetical protein